MNRTFHLFITAFLLWMPQLHFAQSLQSPKDFLGYGLGTRFTPHHRVVAYFQHVASVNSNVKMMQYGETNEHRPLWIAVVSNAENMRRLEEIRTNHLKSVGLMQGSSTGFEKTIIGLSYNVHGNEAVSSEAAMQTMYELADASNGRTQKWLENSVVILDPCMNPDGRDRYVNWYNQMLGFTPNIAPESREHREPWPGGRSNHYLFDLNRDWSWATQLETQHRLRLYQSWMPHIHVDFHEQGYNEPYYFAPAAEPFHKLITNWQRAFQGTIGKNHARYFDQNGWLYFTKERFDLFYPGYGDTWPTYNGSIGMTYEQGGIGAGLGVITASGDTLTLAQRIAHHHTTGLSTIEATAQNAAQVQNEFKKFFQQAPATPYKSYVVRATNPAGTLSAFKKHLDLQGIRYEKLGQSIATKGYNFQTNKEESVSLLPNDLLIKIAQPKGVLAAVLFEPKPILSDSLTYDITAWSLPHAYNLQAFGIPENLNAASNHIEMTTMKPTFSSQSYAFVAKWNSFEDARFVAQLMRSGVKVRFTTRSLTIANQKYDAGSVLIAKTSNERIWAQLVADLPDLAEKYAVRLMSLSTGMAEDGPDIGSSDVRVMKTPNVALLSGNGTSSLSVGEVWHYFDQQLQYPITLIHADDFSRVDWAKYDILIMASGSYATQLDEGNLNKLKDWLRGGGKLIVLEDAMRFLASKEGFGLKIKTTATPSGDNIMPRFDLTERQRLSDNIPGAIYQVQIDRSHPLGYGLPSPYFMLKQTSTSYEYLGNGQNVGTLSKDAPISGFVGANVKKRLQNSLVYGTTSMGRGQIVYMSDSPLFRGFWYAGKFVFANAVFMVGND